MPDFSVYSRIGNLQQFLDANRQANLQNQMAMQDMEFKKQKLQSALMGGDLPAPLQIVNELDRVAQIARDPSLPPETRQLAAERWATIQNTAKTYSTGQGMIPQLNDLNGQPLNFGRQVPINKMMPPNQQILQGDATANDFLDQLAKGSLSVNGAPSKNPPPVDVSQAPNYSQVKNISGYNENISQRAGMQENAKLMQQLALKPSIAGAEKSAQLAAERGGEQAKKEVKASDVLGQLKEVNKLLPKATGSGAGALLGVGKRFVGYSSEQTQADKQLDLLGGWLVSNVPRMEGPQSDKDVANYRDMAGTVADRSIPIQDRQAAAAALEQLMAKYKNQSPSFAQGEAEFNARKQQKSGVVDYSEYFK